MKITYRLLFILAQALCLAACTGTPNGIQAINRFEPGQYVGTWYEIARLDHPFEHGLEQVTATYSLRDDGGLNVVNRGYDPQKKKWQEAVGKAYFIDPPNADQTHDGKLKVSFFGPLYGAYNIIALDTKYYNYAMICGADRSYLWILSRTPQLSFPVKAQLVSQARHLGFATDKLIYVKQ